MNKHTPGPWEYKNRNWRGQIDTHGNLYVAGDRHECYAENDEGELVEDGKAATSVAVVCGNPASGPVTEANARLIAAAPDLLAACEAFIAAADGGLPEFAVETTRAAIAKARG